MLTFIVSFLLLRRLGVSRPLRRALLLSIAMLFAIVLVYTANLFLTLEERTSAPNVHSHSSH
jgi:high-affinity Fe2+/Pb2+ permease